MPGIWPDWLIGGIRRFGSSAWISASTTFGGNARSFSSIRISVSSGSGLSASANPPAFSSAPLLSTSRSQSWIAFAIGSGLLMRSVGSYQMQARSIQYCGCPAAFSHARR